MRPESAKLLRDMKDSAEFILAHCWGLDLERFKRDRLIRDATERNLTVIGEAMTQLARLDAALADSLGPRRKIVAMRNILVHGYGGIDHEVLWGIVQGRLPELLRQVDAALAGQGGT